MDTREARTLVAQVELISHGSVQAWNPSGGHNAETPAMPPGELNPPHITLRAELERALTQTQADRVAEKARDALRQAKYTPDPDEPEWGSFQWRRKIARDIETCDRTVEEAMRHYCVSKATVYRYIAAYGRKTA